MLPTCARLPLLVSTKTSQEFGKELMILLAVADGHGLDDRVQLEEPGLVLPPQVGKRGGAEDDVEDLEELPGEEDSAPLADPLGVVVEEPGEVVGDEAAVVAVLHQLRQELRPSCQGRQTK